MNNVITKEQEIVCPLDASGHFVDVVTDFKGQFVKDADKNIIALLKKQGRLVQAGSVKHNYPFCWRSDTPLLYRHVQSKMFITTKKVIFKSQSRIECHAVYNLREF